MNLFHTLLALTALLCSSAISPLEAGETKVVRITHEVRQIEGWNVQVDVSLLSGEHKATGDLALRIMAERLHQISLRLPADPVAKMREVPIYLDRNHPLGNAHYHPDAGWLENHGYDPAMAKAVHLTQATTLINEARSPHATSVLLHELAHSYHERVLGFDHPGILAGYQAFCDSRKFDQTPVTGGGKRPHYALTDHKEYFAEMTETFFIGNGFFPFNHSELHQEHLPSYELIARIWGTKIKPPAQSTSGEPSVLDLRILATLMAQRGDFEEALALVAKAKARTSDSEGRIGNLQKSIEALRDKATAAKMSVDTPAPATEIPSKP